MAALHTICPADALALLPQRDPAGHKGSFGHVLSVCGSQRYPGAAVLAALGAAHCGAGLVTAAFPLAAYPAIAPQLTVAPLLPLPGNRQGTLRIAALPALLGAMSGKTALLLGCGLGLNGDTRAITETLLREAPCPLVLDADGINAAAAHIDCLRKAHNPAAPRVLTPHPGEMARLTGVRAEAIQQNREDTALAFAREFGVVLVLKGAGTVVAAPEGDRLYINPTGNDGMAKGGSGDLLAGMLAALLAQGMPAFEAACCAVYLHGLAGDRAAARYSRRGVTPPDCLAALKELLSDFE
ncbi:MAG: NAD(P)H-hydrate dehydratase [Oscillospiraceae bacterium]|nr:NAD(P)H-hydrate dehydratase [Oscillospiraceae bacterium]